MLFLCFACSHLKIKKDQKLVLGVSGRLYCVPILCYFTRNNPAVIQHYSRFKEFTTNIITFQ